MKAMVLRGVSMALLGSAARRRLMGTKDWVCRSASTVLVSFMPSRRSMVPTHCASRRGPMAHRDFPSGVHRDFPGIWAINPQVSPLSFRRLDPSG